MATQRFVILAVLVTGVALTASAQPVAGDSASRIGLSPAKLEFRTRSAGTPGGGLPILLQTIVDSHPGAIARLNPEDGGLDVLMGVRISGFAGAPDDVALAFLSQLHANPDKIVPDGGFMVSRSFDTVAGGRRLLFEGYGSHQDLNYVVGINRARRGERFYVDAAGRVAPPGFVFVRSSETMDYGEERNDWYVYFVLRSSHPRQDALTANRDEVDYLSAGIHRPPVGARREAWTPPDESCPGADFTFTGLGNVYAANPLHGDPQLGVLLALCNQSPVFLDGRYVRVVPETGSPAEDEDGTLDFDPGEAAFGDVSVYFHVGRFLTLMFSLGFPEVANDWKILAHTQSTSTTTARALYRTRELAFGIQTPPYRDATHEASFIAHETTHLLQFDITQSFFGWGEKEHWALGESYADYFGIVYRSYQLGHLEPWRFPVFGEYVAPQMHLDLPRDLSSTEPHYSGYSSVNYVGSPDVAWPINLYDHSLIFSTALLDYDRLDDSQSSAAFVVESLFNLPPAPSFRNGRDALMIAASDCAVSGAPETYQCCETGACNQHVARAFGDRGIGEIDEGVVLSGSENGAIDPASHVLSVEGVFPNPFSSATSIAFTLTRPERVQLSVYDVSGRLISHLLDKSLSSGRHDIRWDPHDLPSGPYFFEIHAGSSVRRTSVVHVR